MDGSQFLTIMLHSALERLEWIKSTVTSGTALFLLNSAVVSVVVSALVSFWLGPCLTIRQEKARRRLVVRDEIVRALQLLLRHLRNVELQNQALAAGGQAVEKWFISDYERMLWPVVRALDNPDIGQRLARRLRALIQELLGLWRMDYLAICVTENLENALDRYPIQPRHLVGPISLLERLCGVEAGNPVVAAEAVAKAEEMIDLLANSV